MGLLELLPTSPLGLRGKPGPNFENIGQRGISDIQALVKGQNLISSQDMVTGRTYGKAQYVANVPASQLDLNGQTPSQYLNHLPR